MKQKKFESLIEAIANTFIGFIITMMVYPLVNWICDIHMNVGQATLSTLLFTIISVARSYCIRRFFNNLSYIKQKVTLIFTTNWDDVKR